MQNTDALAPELMVSQWLNTPAPLSLASLRGRVVLVHTFQMLCPGCVQHGVPQAQRVHQAFAGTDLAVLGLHTVFEHHSVMSPAALQVFLHEYRVKFPVGIDAPGDDGPVPRTMERYGLQGTPSLLAIDRHGVLRLNHFGALDDLRLGALLGQLLAQPTSSAIGAG